MGSVLSFGRKRRDSDADDAAAIDEGSSKDILKVSPWDAGSMKRTLDEKVPQYLTEATGLSEDKSYQNLKLGIMFVSVVFGCVAQFYPLPFPSNRALLAVCVVVYFALSAVLQYQISFGDRDFLWSSKAADGKGAVCVRNVPVKHSDKVEFVIESPWRKEVGRVSTSVGAFFTVDGHFSEGALARYVSTTLAPAVVSAASKKDR